MTALLYVAEKNVILRALCTVFRSGALDRRYVALQSPIVVVDRDVFDRIASNGCDNQLDVAKPY